METSSMAEVDWAELLNQSRARLQGETDDEVFDYKQISSLLALLKSLLEKYDNLLEPPSSSSETPSISSLLSKEEKKKCILNVRAALRLALTWASSTDDAKFRDRIVNGAISDLALHQVLLRVVARKKGDARCRVLSTQLLSNLVTSHTEAAQTITGSLSLSPSEESITAAIRQHLIDENDQHQHEKSPQQVNQSGNTIEEENYQLTWVDLLLSCARSGNRDALAGIVAFLHNAIVSMQKGDPSVTASSSSNSSNQKFISFACQLARDSTMVNTLLRYVISVEAIKPIVGGGEEKKDAKIVAKDEEATTGDTATDWITLLLVKCCKLGLFPDMISSIGGKNETVLLESDCSLVTTPEHIVLFQCIQSEVETSNSSSSKDECVLGGEIGIDAVLSTHFFLAKIFIKLRNGIEIDNLHLLLASDEPIESLKFSAVVSVIDILACSLGDDNNFVSSVRDRIAAEEPTLIEGACKDLGSLIDSLTSRNKGKKNRDFVIHDEEKSLMTSLVRLIGNLCFDCRENQDLVRQTLVPAPVQIVSSSSSDGERNGVHVLLSCTSLSHACFTLREWAVIAIRNLLDKNELNQAEVAKLEANEPVQSAELASLGIKVDLDPKGNVSVVPNN